jgi:acetyltransferase
MIHQKIRESDKPIYAILPSTVNVHEEIKHFIHKGNLAFSDEYQFGTCLSKITNSASQINKSSSENPIDVDRIQALIKNFPNGFINPEQVYELLTAANIKMAKQVLVHSETDLLNAARSLEYPVVQKVVGPLHKSDTKGVITSVLNITELMYNFRKLIRQKGVKAVMIQQMISGKEVFIGSKRESGFSPLILCGAGGIYIEALHDISNSLAPVDINEAKEMVDQLQIKPILEGIRGEAPCNLEAFYETIKKVSDLLMVAPEIAELDINPLMISKKGIISVDARIKIKK